MHFFAIAIICLYDTLGLVGGHIGGNNNPLRPNGLGEYCSFSIRASFDIIGLNDDVGGLSEMLILLIVVAETVIKY